MYRRRTESHGTHGGEEKGAELHAGRLEAIKDEIDSGAYDPDGENLDRALPGLAEDIGVELRIKGVAET